LLSQTDNAFTVRRGEKRTREEKEVVITAVLVAGGMVVDAKTAMAWSSSFFFLWKIN
jgi:hypothetical protein